MIKRTAALLGALVLLICIFTGCSEEQSDVKVELNLDVEEQLNDLTFHVSHYWEDMGAQEGIENSHMYTVGKSQQNYIGLSLLYFDDAALELDPDMEGGEVLDIREVDLGDGGYEYRVATGTEERPSQMYHVRIPYGGGVYVISLMGYDLSPADEMWENFLNHLEFGN